MPLVLWLLLLVVAGIPLLLWALVQVARLGRARRWVVHFPAHGPVPVRIYTGHWFGRLVPMAGVTLRRRIYLDHPGIALPPGGGVVTTRDMLIHELVHIRQAEERGLWYVPAYLWAAVRTLGSGHDGHPLEIEADRLSAAYVAGNTTAIAVPEDLLAAYPFPSPRRAR